MSSALKILEEVVKLVGPDLVGALAKALIRGDVAGAQRASRIVAETVAAKEAVRRARERLGKKG
jgi:hypothetical protein